MKHDKYKEYIYLDGIDELTLAEKSDFEKHIEECAECREEFLSVKNLQSALIDNRPAAPSEETLYNARNELFENLAAKEQKEFWLTQLKEFISGFLFGNPRVAFAGAFSLVIGLILGAAAVHFNASSGTPAAAPQNIISEIKENNFRVSNVRFPGGRKENGEIEISFDAVKPVKYKGSIDDAFTRHLLAASLSNADNPGVKLQTINTIRDMPGESSVADPAVKRALIISLKTDENPGVRREAMNVLTGYTFDEEIKQAFIFALSNDPNSGIRVAAINALASKEKRETHLDDKLKDILENMAETEDNNFIRLRAASILKEVE